VRRYNSDMSENDISNQILKIVAYFERGILLERDASWHVLDLIEAGNVASVFNILPNQFKQQLLEEAKSAPVTEQEWESAEYFQFGSSCFFPGSEPSSEMNRTERENWKRRYRGRIEVLREFLASNQISNCPTRFSGAE
jgi:hypothetical protein